MHAGDRAIPIRKAGLGMESKVRNIYVSGLSAAAVLALAACADTPLNNIVILCGGALVCGFAAPGIVEYVLDRWRD
jgi:hypothetical protein